MAVVAIVKTSPFSFTPLMATKTDASTRIADNKKGGWYGYRASKAALNMVVKAAAMDYPKAKLMVIHPGWVQTEMGGPSAPTTVQDSVAGMRKVISGLKQSESGSFHSFDGQVMVW